MASRALRRMLSTNSADVGRPTFEGTYVSLRNASWNARVSELILHREEKRNALSKAVINELGQCISLTKGSSTRALLLRSSSPSTFCAGADLSERRELCDSSARALSSRLRETFLQLSRLPMPSIALITGAARGGGVELALSCDMTVCGAEATFAFPETHLGVIPGAGGCVRLPRRVGYARAMDLVATARVVDANEAKDMGLAQFLEGSAEDALEFAKELARIIANAAPNAMRLAKLAMAESCRLNDNCAFHTEAACYYQTFLHAHERAEGLAAFAEKRPPAYEDCWPSALLDKGDDKDAMK